MSHVKQGSRAAAVCVLVAACLLAWCAPAFATETQTTSQPAESSTAISTETRTLSSSTVKTSEAEASASESSADAKAALILDASFSMLEEDADGPRIDAAKKATHELIDSLPATAQMGLFAYGAQESNAPDNREAGCRDIQRLVPVGEVDKEEFGSAIDGLTPKGYTPMGNALREAAEELGDEGERSIILVSDGIDTCAPPEVCDVAKELAGEGVDLAIHTVGFKADEEARAELECIAEAGGGQFLEAADASSLAESLKFLAQRGVVKYQTAGTPFEFADNPEDAKWLGEGQYLTTVTPDRSGTTDRYFRTSVPPRHNARMVFTPVVQGDAMWQHTEVKVDPAEGINEGDPACGEFRGKDEIASGGPGFGINSAFAAMNRVEEDHLECDMSDILVKIQISNAGDEVAEDVPIEVGVFYEPIPGKEQADDWEDRRVYSAGEFQGEMPIANSQPVSGGTGFNDAVEITEGSYSDRIVPGEFKFFKIPVAYGQRPVIRAKTPPSVARNADTIAMGIYDPLRVKAASQRMSFFDDPEESDPEAPNQYVWYGSDTPYQGDFYVWFGMDWATEGYDIAGVDQPFEFEVLLDGEPANGGPDWTPSHENGPEPSDEPITFDAADSAATTSASEDESDDGQEVNAASDEQDGGFGLVPTLLGGLLVLLLVAAAVVFFIVRKQRGNWQ
ncbi:VWA domain-containing protein [Corynebacterium sp. p3-SID1056]|uniref:vWA domain-containing protein n=1 Tax=Corynebacterium sp. p3-SID1056 TaxID=2916092 RepID=UPI0021A3CD7C|nr:VWA domain-containing protein [Corynebacterium sp. p3-SID1056]MCT2339698.1 VWA domain-containing protein [Corynebacterium sp. p3-SID1056]